MPHQKGKISTDTYKLKGSQGHNARKKSPFERLDAIFKIMQEENRSLTSRVYWGDIGGQYGLKRDRIRDIIHGGTLLYLECDSDHIKFY